MLPGLHIIDYIALFSVYSRNMSVHFNNNLQRKFSGEKNYFTYGFTVNY